MIYEIQTAAGVWLDVSRMSYSHFREFYAVNPTVRQQRCATRGSARYIRA